MLLRMNRILLLAGDDRQLCASCFGSDQPGLPAGVVVTQNPKDKRLRLKRALRRMTVPDGFSVSLFAGEPNVMQPIAFDFDDRGRRVVVETFRIPIGKRLIATGFSFSPTKTGTGDSMSGKFSSTKAIGSAAIAIGFGVCG